MEKDTEVLASKNSCTSKFSLAMFDIADAVVSALVIATLLLTVVCMKFDVIGTSMVPTLRNNDKLIVYHLLYEPNRGDIITVENPGQLSKNLVKRIIAKGNDKLHIDFETGSVYVNGELLSESYINNPTTQPADWDIPEVIPEGYYFVMGDNRGNSKDSRSHEVGLVTRDEIMGKAILIYSPLNRIKVL